MNLKLLILLISLLYSQRIYAQDTLYTVDGKRLLGEVQTIDNRNIHLKRSTANETSDYTIPKKKVTKIVYKSGTTTWINELTGKPQNNSHSAVCVSVANLNHYRSGFGFACEGSNNAGTISFYFPLNLTFMNGLYNFEPSSGRDLRIFQMMPGVKFYPRGNRGKVRYAVGPQLCMESGWYHQSATSPGGTRYTDEVSVLNLGGMVNNSVNVFLPWHLYLGTELALGISPQTPMMQTNFRLGYHF